MIRITRYASLSAALVVGIVGLALLIIDRSANPTLADTLRKIRESRTISFRCTVEQKGKPKVVMRQSMASPGLVRMQMQFGDNMESISIFDQQKSAGLALLPQQKRAIRISSAEGLPKQGLNVVEFIDWLKSAQDHSKEDLGPKMIDGKSAFGFQVKKDDQPYKIWIDQQSGDPLRMEAQMEFLGQPMTMVADDFVLDAKLNQSLFSLTPPVGYQVTEELQAREPSEKELVVILRKLVEANDGKFPADLELTTLTKLWGKNTKPPGQPGSLQETYTLTLALMFLNMQKVEYVGENVKFGESQKIVCWWTPKGKKNYRAIFGDLTIRDGETVKPAASK